MPQLNIDVLDVALQIDTVSGSSQDAPDTEALDEGAKISFILVFS